MAYQKQTFVDGVTVLGATQLQHIEDGIVAVEKVADAAPKQFKTINDQSIVGVGNITVGGDSGGGQSSNTMQSLYDSAKQLATRFTQQYFHGPAVEKNVIDIFLFAGQSNSCGRAQLTDVETDNDIIVKVSKSKAFTFNNGQSDVPTEIVEPISANGSSGYGYIPSFLNSYYAVTGRVSCACYCSVGGTMLNKFVPFVLDDATSDPTSEQNALYTKMRDAVLNAKTNLGTNGYEVGHVFLVWCQGEQDAYEYGRVSGTGLATAYEESLTEESDKKAYYKKLFISMVDSLKRDVGLKNTFIVRIGHEGGYYDGSLSIIRAQNELGAEMDDYVVVSTIFAGAKKFIEDDGSIRDLMRDSAHYKPEGYARAGLEAGVNAGIYVNSGFSVKPVLVEYNSLLMEEHPNVIDAETYFEREVDKFLYNPALVGFGFLKKLTSTPVESVTITGGDVTVEIGETKQLSVTVYPADAANQSVSFISNNPSVCSITGDGVIEGKMVGDTEITVMSDENPSITDTVSVTVVSDIVAVESIEITTSTPEMSIGEKFTFAAEVSPGTATNKAVIWSSSNPLTLTINQTTGEAECLRPGTAQITATSSQNPEISNTVSVTCSYASLDVGESVAMDFESKTLDDYVSDGVVSYGDSTGAGLTYNEGLVLNTTGLAYGVTIPKRLPVSSSWTIEVNAKLDASLSGTQFYDCLAIVSGDMSDTTSFGPAICFDTPLRIQGRFREMSGAAVEDRCIANNAIPSDNAFHTYKFVKTEGGNIEYFRDDASIGTFTKSDVGGDFVYLLGYKKGNTSGAGYSPRTGCGMVVKSISIRRDA